MDNSPTTDIIYKICLDGEWEAAQSEGVYSGSDVDRRDGFIHFSTASQVRKTALKHFRDQANLVLIAVNPDRLGQSLRWEPSRGGDLFPHLYASLSLDAVVWVKQLPLDSNGNHQFPSAII